MANNLYVVDVHFFFIFVELNTIFIYSFMTLFFREFTFGSISISFLHFFGFFFLFCVFHCFFFYYFLTYSTSINALAYLYLHAHFISNNRNLTKFLYLNELFLIYLNGFKKKKNF